MASIEKLIGRLEGKPSDFTWKEAIKLLSFFGYKVVTGGSGSHRRFHNKETDHLIMMVEPHPRKILKKWQVRKLLDDLRGKNLI
jgi:predicted RNA binding protein YcfA (HicA-like mRNA interferase family)